jgi:hypothetical protein
MMAYLDLREAFAEGAPVAVPADVLRIADDDIGMVYGGFTPLEWRVIALARTDRLSSLSAPGSIARLMSRLFGVRRQSALADPRLEALRHAAVHAWHRGYQLPVSQIKAFLAAGFSSDQFDTLLASVIAQRAAVRGKALA